MKLENGKVYHNDDFSIMFRVLNCEVSENIHGLIIEADQDFTESGIKYNEIRMSGKNVFIIPISTVLGLKEFSGCIYEYSEKTIRNFVSNKDYEDGALFDVHRSFCGTRDVLGFDKVTEIIKE